MHKTWRPKATLNNIERKTRDEKVLEVVYRFEGIYLETNFFEESTPLVNLDYAVNQAISLILLEYQVGF